MRLIYVINVVLNVTNKIINKCFNKRDCEKSQRRMLRKSSAYFNNIIFVAIMNDEKTFRKKSQIKKNTYSQKETYKHNDFF